VETALAVVGLTPRAEALPSHISAANSSASELPAPLSTDPPCCCATSRPATSTASRATEILNLLQGSIVSTAKTIIMVTHDPHASARRADGVLKQGFN